MIPNMVSINSLFHPINILFDPDNPCYSPPESLYYRAVNTGSWYLSTEQKGCTLTNHIIMLFCHFIDGISVDAYGNLTVEAVITCGLWFNRKIQNGASAWWVQDFTEDRHLF